MATSEQLLNEYALSGNPACFRSLVEELGGMVYAVCLRITADPHAAEDLSQDCFLELARKASTIRTSIAGWLHSTATNRALNLIRSRKQDQKRVLLAASTAPIHESEDFGEIQKLVDEAVDRLDQQLRQIVISHYLEGKTQAEIAERLGVDQSTISRRLTQGLEDVRNHLRRLGVLTTLAALASILGSSNAIAAPQTLTGTAAKIGLAGIGWTATKSSTWSLGLFLSTFAATVGNILLYLFCEGWLFFLLLVLEIVIISFPPKWFRECFTVLCHGDDPWAQPAFPWKKWTWTTPPRDWKQRLFAWSWMGILFDLVALQGLLHDPHRWVEPMCLAIVGTLFGLIPAIRMGIRVWLFRGNLPLTAVEASTQPKEVETWEKIACAVACVIVSLSILITGSVIQSPEGKIPWISLVIIWSLPVGSIAFLFYAFRSRWKSGPKVARSTPQEGSLDASANLPRLKQIQFGLLMLFLMGSVLSLGMSFFSTTVAWYVLQEPYVRNVPFAVVVEGGFCLICAIGFCSFLFRMREQLIRWNYAVLLAVGIGLMAGGLTAISYGDYLALTMPLPDERPTSEQPLTPDQLAANENTQRLRRKYARELAAVMPRVIPAGFQQRNDALHMFPVVQEARTPQLDDATDAWWDGTLRKWIDQLELPVPPQIERVHAILVNRYVKVVSKAEKMVLIHTFVCASRSDAESLAEFWGPRAIHKGYLVTVPFESKGGDRLTSNDPLILAVRRQMDSSDLSSGPPE